MTRCVIGVDIGTTTVKGVVLTEHGTVTASATSARLKNTSPHPGWAEQDPAGLISAVIGVLRELASTGGKSVVIEAIAMASQSGSTVEMGADAAPRGNLITWMDSRAEPIVSRWRTDGMAERFKAITGWEARAGLGSSTIAWLTQNSPASATGPSRFSGADDFIAHGLTGRWTTNTSNASGMQLMDLRLADWSDELCAAVGIESVQLSAIQKPGSEIGWLTPEVAAVTGLGQATKVIAGGHDQTCTAFALGLTEPGQVLLATGTAWVLTAVLTEGDLPAVPESMGTSRHVITDRWTASRLVGGFGASLQWWTDICGLDHPTITTTELGAEALTSNASGVEFVSTGANIEGSGAPGAGLFVGETQSTTRGERTLAVMTSAAQAVTEVLEALPRTSSLTMVGGATRSHAWPQVVADVTGRIVDVVQDESLPALAAAAIAGVGVGVFSDTTEALAAVHPEATQITPRKPQDNGDGPT